MSLSKLSKSPIVEASVEIRCVFTMPAEAIIGIVYNVVNNNGIGKGEIRTLPIAQIPIEVRQSNPNLRDKPTHRILCKEGDILIGPENIIISITPPYISWDVFKDFIMRVLKSLQNSSIFRNVKSVNIRYLNFFKLNIFDKINLNIQFKEKEIKYPSTIVKTEIPAKNNIIEILQITNGVHLKNILLKIDSDGSLIDINSIKKEGDFQNLDKIIEECHIEAENLFGDLLKADYLQSLK